MRTPGHIQIGLGRHPRGDAIGARDIGRAALGERQQCKDCHRDHCGFEGFQRSTSKVPGYRPLRAVKDPWPEHWLSPPPGAPSQRSGKSPEWYSVRCSALLGRIKRGFPVNNKCRTIGPSVLYATLFLGIAPAVLAQSADQPGNASPGANVGSGKLQTVTVTATAIPGA